MKKIPIGVDDFKEIISNDFYYVDKTKSIEDILSDGSKVKLFKNRSISLNMVNTLLSLFL